MEPTITLFCNIIKINDYESKRFKQDYTKNMESEGYGA